MNKTDWQFAFEIKRGSRNPIFKKIGFLKSKMKSGIGSDNTDF